MKKMRMCFPNEKTFADGFAEYILDCKARNLRDGTINHYRGGGKEGGKGPVGYVLDLPITNVIARRKAMWHSSGRCCKFAGRWANALHCTAGRSIIAPTTEGQIFGLSGWVVGETFL